MVGPRRQGGSERLRQPVGQPFVRRPGQGEPPQRQRRPDCSSARLPDMTRYAGIGLRQPHYEALLAAPPALPFDELHSENFFGDGGAALAVLQAARERWPVSLHGVGLALGSVAGLDALHLRRLAALASRIDPVRVSDHASFARAPRRSGGSLIHGADLLPIAFTDASLAIMVANVQRVQEAPIRCEEAERIGRSHGVARPGSQHFVLASFDLKDGTARQAFSNLDASPEGFAEAIRAQFEAALRHAGVELPPHADPEPATTIPSPNASRLYRSAASGQSLIQRIAADARKQRSLLAVDMLVAAALEECSIAARAARPLRSEQGEA